MDARNTTRRHAYRRVIMSINVHAPLRIVQTGRTEFSVYFIFAKVFLEVSHRLFSTFDLFVSMFLLSGLKLYRVVLKAVQALIPETAVLLDPLGGLSHWRCFEL